MNDTVVPVVAIDGPSGSGKGTVARRVADTLGWHLLDSGALYRIVAVAAADRGISEDDGDALATCATGLDIVFDVDEQGGERILVDGNDVTDRVRAEDTGAAASRVAAVAALRTALMEVQRGFRRPPGLVADGRDMGTVVFPDAGCKVFLTASPEARAERRYKQLKGKGFDGTLAALFDDIVSRDARDKARAVAPLRPAADAIQLDSTGLDVETVVQRVLELIRT